MKSGYVRGSTDEKNLHPQPDPLKKAGCDRIFVEKMVSGNSMTWGLLARAIQQIKKLDFLIVR